MSAGSAPQPGSWTAKQEHGQLLPSITLTNKGDSSRFGRYARQKAGLKGNTGLHPKY